MGMLLRGWRKGGGVMSALDGSIGRHDTLPTEALDAARAELAALRAERDEARARAAKLFALLDGAYEQLNRIYEILEDDDVPPDSACELIEAVVHERAEVAPSILSQRDAARIALAALLDALAEGPWFVAVDEQRSVADAIEAAERVLGRRES